jgi:hypothetical protein
MNTHGGLRTWGRLSAFILLLLLPAQALAQRSGCPGLVGSGGVKIYKWPRAVESERLAKVPARIYIWVYNDYSNPSFYLVSRCAPGATCTRADNTDNNPNNDPTVGFVLKTGLTLGQCFDPGHTHPDAARPVGSGARYTVRSRDLYLRSVEIGKRNHPYGLLRRGDTFIRSHLDAQNGWLYGWAFGNGINPGMRYGRVLWNHGHNLSR